jgi:hypothetical protein
VGTVLETSVRNVFAAGNLVHAAETADVAALGGIHAARHIAAALRAGQGMAVASPVTLLPDTLPPDTLPLDTVPLGTPSPHAPPPASAPPAPLVPITVDPPLAWISPNAIRFFSPPGDTPISPPRGRFLLRSQVFRRRAVLEVRQGDRVLARNTARLIPGRPVHLDAGWLARTRPSDGPVLVALARG